MFAEKLIYLERGEGFAYQVGKALYPAADENVIAVTATDQSDGIFRDANRCPASCVAAPGVDVLVAEPGAAYGFLSGTSMAAAHVSGVAALLLDVMPNLDPKAVRNLLFKTARRLNSGEHEKVVAGIVDAYQALKSISETTATETVSPIQLPPDPLSLP
jgi:subtilisin family serine protease